MRTTKPYNFVEQLIDGLKNTATELEELKVQIALGKAEAKDLFEDLKKKFNETIEYIKSVLKQVENTKTNLILLVALQHLQVQMSRGFAETPASFEKQRTEIEMGLDLVEKKMRVGIEPEHLASLQLDIERFRSKMQLIALKYKLKKLSMEYKFDGKKTELIKKLDEIKQELIVNEVEFKNKWQDKKKHIKKTFHDLGTLLLPID